MNFYSHILSWLQWELFEGLIIIIFGILLAILWIIFWQFGTSATAKFFIIPLFVMAGLFLVAGSYLRIENTKRMQEFPVKYEQNQQDFIISEKKRVEDFQMSYVFTKIIATVCFIFAILIFWFVKNNFWQAMAICLVFFGLSGLVIDYFSENRAKVYYEKILQNIKK